MTALKLLNREYSQKSTLFLYSVLGIPRQVDQLGYLRYDRIAPVATFMSWEKKYLPVDRVLTCVYILQDSKQFQEFERNTILTNPRYNAMHLLNDEYVAYTFLFDKPDDYNHFGKVYSGRYSQIHPDYKQQILKYYRKPIPHCERMRTYLYPLEKDWETGNMNYVKAYAQEAVVPSGDFRKDMQDLQRYEKMMVQVGELCSKPDYNKEELDINLRSLDFFKKRLTLSKYQNRQIK